MTDSLENLIPTWLTVPEIAERLGIRITAVRRLIDERELLAARIGERSVLAVPAGFFGNDGPLPELKGTFTVLADGGMSDAEIIEWLHTADATMPPSGGTPIDAIHAGFKTEVRRRAMEQAI